MKKVIDILRYARQIVFTIYSLVVFVVLMMLLVQPVIAICFIFGKTTEKKRLNYHRSIQKMAIIAQRMLPGVRFHLHNPEGETFDKPSLIIANHQSHFDLLCIMMLAPKIVIMTNDWVWRNPLYGLLIRYAEYYPASNGLEQNLDRLRSLVDRGYSVMIFPEGTRSADLEVHRFHKGAFYIAEKLHLDVVPISIHGAGIVLNKKAWLINSGDINIEVFKRVDADDASFGSDYHARTKAFRAFIATKYACQRQRYEKGGHR